MLEGLERRKQDGKRKIVSSILLHDTHDTHDTPCRWFRHETYSRFLYSAVLLPVRLLVNVHCSNEHCEPLLLCSMCPGRYISDGDKNNTIAKHD